LLQQRPHPILVDSVVDDAVEPLAHFGPVALNDRFDQQLAQRCALEQAAQHVKDLAVECPALRL